MCVPLTNEKQDNSPRPNERRGLTALWSSQKENQETVTVMEQTVFLWPMRSKTILPQPIRDEDITALWSNQKKNQETVAVMEQEHRMCTSNP